jgi:hypothetical protein
VNVHHGVADVSASGNQLLVHDIHVTVPVNGMVTGMRFATNACHICPQGAGLLNPYGRRVEKAQSLQAGNMNRLKQAGLYG